MRTEPAEAVLEEFMAAINQRVSAQPHNELLRLEVSKRGNLQAQLQCGDGLTWIRWNRGKIEELDAGQDAEIPLSARLSDNTRPDDLKILNYRPGRRLVLLDTGGPKPLVIKGFRRRKADKISIKYDVACRAFTEQDIRTPEFTGSNKDLACLSMAYEPGEPLVLSVDAADLFGKIGKGLSDFQNHTAQVELEIFGSREEMNVIDGLAERLTGAGFGLPHNWLVLKERLQSAEKKLPRPHIGLCHRDLYDKQFIQHQDHIALLDFDLLCRADVALDPANFLAHLVLRKLQGVRSATQKSIDICGQSFLQCLGRNGEPGFRERLKFYQATTFCRLALVYSLRPSWVGLLPDLLDMGNHCLDDLRPVQSNYAE